jgi:putative ABC transport system substrate-binding protein
MRRREFITLIGGAATAWSLSARAQDKTKRLIGLLAAASPESALPQTNAIHEGLSNLGYVDGRDYQIFRKWAYGVMDRLPALLEELVQLKPDLIVANPTPAIVAVRAFTKTIPIVSFMITDEMRLGLVASHAHPGSNVTGLLMRVEGMVGKQLELAAQTIPGAKKIGIVFNPASADAPAQRQEAEAASTAFGANIVYAEVGTPNEVNSALQKLENERVQVVVVLFDALFFQERKQIADLAAGLRLPVVYSARDHVISGGLISYGISLSASARRMAIYIDKIFKGANPADLPLEFPTKLELVINLKTAKTLSLTVPPTLLARADEVIE